MSKSGIAVFGNTLLALAILAAAGAPALEAANCKTSYRIWQEGQNTYYQHGETVVLEVGEKVDLYVHAYPSGGEHPYSAAADIGASAAFGVGGHGIQDVRRYLRLGEHNPQKGKLALTGKAAGNTALGYEITGVASPARLRQVPRGCRVGRSRISVRQATSAPPAAPPPPAQQAVGSANDAAHQLIMQLYTGILRRNPAEARDYPDSFFDQVLRSGHSGLLSIAETMTASPEFRRAAISRTRSELEKSGVAAGGLSQQVLEDQLLTDISQSLYGGELYRDTRQRLASQLSNCLSGRGGDAVCRQLGRNLLTQRQYYDRNGDLFQYWR